MGKARCLLFVCSVCTVYTACVDDFDSCGLWASTGDCEKNSYWMALNCPISCQASCLCPGSAHPGKPADTRCDCIEKTEEGFCDNGPNFMDTECQTTCALRATLICPSPPAVAHTVFTVVGEYKWLSTVTYECAPYAFTTNTDPEYDGNRVCLRGKTWSLYDTSKDPECYVKNCTDSPLDIPFTTWSAVPPKQIDGSYVYNASINYACVTGYERQSGDNSRRCYASATYVGFTSWTPIVCQKKDCGNPPQRSNAKLVSKSGTAYLETSIYHCVDGYVMNGKKEVTVVCQESAKWDIFNCYGVDCGAVPVISNGNYSSDSTRYPNNATYRCEDGFHLTGNSILKCGVNGQWDGPSPRCIALQQRKLWLYVGVPITMLSVSGLAVFIFVYVRYQRRSIIVKALIRYQ